MLSYYQLGWKTIEDFSYRSPNFQSQGGSSNTYQEQIQLSYDEEMFYALWNEVKKDKRECNFVPLRVEEEI